MKKHSFSPRKSQRGIVLIVAMIMLAIMSILAISSIRNISLEEWMSASMHDRSIAIRAAEAAMQAGMVDASGNKAGLAGFNADAELTTSPPAINGGFVAIPTAESPNWMASKDDTWWNNNNNARALPSILGALVVNQPRYLIEYRGKTVCKPPSRWNPTTGAREEADREDCNTPEGAAISPTCNCYLFRITARSNPGAGRAEVILQSLYTTF